MTKIPEKRVLNVVKAAGVMQHAPIETYISHDEVSVRIGLNTFLAALVRKVGNPMLLITRGQLDAKLRTAADEVISEMKAETVHAV